MMNTSGATRSKRKSRNPMHLTVKNADYKEKEREFDNSIDEIAALPMSTSDLSRCVSSPLGMQGRKGFEEIPVELDGYKETKYQQAVRVIRKLECLGHIDGNFRKEFITWLSHRASEKRIAQISVIIDTLSDDSQVLADQLVHTFGEEIRAQ